MRILRPHWMTAVIGTTLLCSACSTMPSKPAPYQQQPAFDLREYFNGPVEAWGQFQGRNGDVVKRFKVDMVGTWQGTHGTLNETFRYDDGSTEQRIWHLTDLGQGRYQGTAADVVGVAQGRSDGAMFRWAYTLDLPVGQRRYQVQFDDRMYRHDASHVINRATVRKFGVRVGEVTLFFAKPNTANSTTRNTTLNTTSQPITE